MNTKNLKRNQLEKALNTKQMNKVQNVRTKVLKYKVVECFKIKVARSILQVS